MSGNYDGEFSRRVAEAAATFAWDKERREQERDLRKVEEHKAIAEKALAIAGPNAIVLLQPDGIYVQPACGRGRPWGVPVGPLTAVQADEVLKRWKATVKSLSRPAHGVNQPGRLSRAGLDGLITEQRMKESRDG